MEQASHLSPAYLYVWEGGDMSMRAILLPGCLEDQVEWIRWSGTWRNLGG